MGGCKKWLLQHPWGEMGLTPLGWGKPSSAPDSPTAFFQASVFMAAERSAGAMGCTVRTCQCLQKHGLKKKHMYSELFIFLVLIFEILKTMLEGGLGGFAAGRAQPPSALS